MDNGLRKQENRETLGIRERIVSFGLGMDLKRGGAGNRSEGWGKNHGFHGFHGFLFTEGNKGNEGTRIHRRQVFGGQVRHRQGLRRDLDGKFLNR
jgi:hypothetical protein